MATRASTLAIRKQAEPTASGRHACRRVCSSPRWDQTAIAVLTLKQSVPTNCTAAAHQSARASGCFQAPLRQRPLSRSCTNAALVKNNDPTNSVTLAPRTVTRSTYQDITPIAKHSDPSAKPSDSRRSQRFRIG